MKKYYIYAIILLAKYNSFAQSPQEIGVQIAEFINATTQIPFMAKVANVQGAVRVRVKFNENNHLESYSINQSLRKDCDNEALRVVKLVNINTIKKLLGDKKAVVFEVNFQNNEFFAFENGYKYENIDENNLIISNLTKASFLRRYPVDTTTGIVKGKVEYFKYVGEKPVGIGFYNLKIDSTERHSIEILEKTSDTLSIITKSQADYNSYFPNYFGSIFSNGQIARKFDGKNTMYSYYPNGRISTISHREKEIENVKKWYANGQMAYEKNVKVINSKEIENYTFVWDTHGNQLVIEGNGICKLYETNDVEIIGEMKEGMKNGFWIGKSMKGDTLFQEIYKDGIFKSGINFTGQTYIKYEQDLKMAEFNGGLKSLGNFLQRNLRYPEVAQKSNIQGKVFISFYVCTDGSLCDYQILKGVSPELNEEALRVVKLQSGKWKPSQHRGVDIKSKFNLPISFILNRYP